MRVEMLEAFGVAPDIIAIWRNTIGAELLPVQLRAVKEFGLFGKGNLVVFAPTSSGKTFIGEMGAIEAVRRKMKVFYLVPQKALAEEKFDELSRRYAEASIKVVISTRDRREFDEEIAAGKFQIAVVVFEKLQALLVGHPQLLQNIGLVVVDEMQLITDETRGPSLELLLTKLLSANPRPRIIGLSAVLGNAELLARWLRAELLVEKQRPVELRKGVLCKGAFYYREHNGGTEGTEPFIDCGLEKTDDLILSAAEDLVRRQEPVLIFLPDRESTVRLARILAGRVNLATPAATAAIEELREQEDTHARDALLETLDSSVAFHNADLAPHERRLVERHFRDGSIRALFSTSTLAMGMNLPVKNVILEEQKWASVGQRGKRAKMDLTKSEYENMSGRAGRLSKVADFGRSILVTAYKSQVQAWLDFYVKGDFEQIAPTLKNAPLENHVVNLLASGIASSRDGLAELLLGSYTGFAEWAPSMGRDGFVAALDKAIAVCARAEMVRSVGERLEVTDVGRICARKGIGVDTGSALADWAREATTAPLTEIEILSVVALTPAGENAYCNMSGKERWDTDYRGQVLMRAERDGVANRPLFVGFASDRYAATYDGAKAMKKALFVCAWIDEARTKEIESAFLVWGGAIRRVAEEFSWLVDALAEIAKVCHWTKERCQQIEDLATRLAHGVREDALPLARLRVLGLGRAHIRRLVNAGLATEEPLREKTQDELRKVIGNRRVAAALWERLHAPKAELAYAAVANGSSLGLRAAEPTPPEYGAPVLRIDVGEHRASYSGIEIPTKPPGNLQPQLFRALAVLAGHAGQPVAMGQMADEMFVLGGLRRRPVEPESRDLRYRLVRTLKAALAPRVAADEIEAMIENVVGVGLRLVATGRVEVIGAPAAQVRA